MAMKVAATNPTLQPFLQYVTAGRELAATWALPLVSSLLPPRELVFCKMAAEKIATDSPEPLVALVMHCESGQSQFPVFFFSQDTVRLGQGSEYGEIVGMHACKQEVLIEMLKTIKNILKLNTVFYLEKNVT